MASVRYGIAGLTSRTTAQRYYRNDRKMMSANPDHHQDAHMTRRSIFIGTASSLIFAPSIVRAANLMKIRGLILPIDRPRAGFVERLRYYYLEKALRRGWDAQDAHTLNCRSESQARSSVACARKNGWLPTPVSGISDLTKTDPHRDPQFSFEAVRHLKTNKAAESQ